MFWFFTYNPPYEKRLVFSYTTSKKKMEQFLGILQRIFFIAPKHFEIIESRPDLFFLNFSFAMSIRIFTHPSKNLIFEKMIKFSILTQSRNARARK